MTRPRNNLVQTVVMDANKENIRRWAEEGLSINLIARKLKLRTACTMRTWLKNQDEELQSILRTNGENRRGGAYDTKEKLT